MVYAENQWLGVYAVLVFIKYQAQPLTVAGAALVGLGFVFWVRNKQTVQLPVKLRLNESKREHQRRGLYLYSSIGIRVCAEFVWCF